MLGAASWFWGCMKQMDNQDDWVKLYIWKQFPNHLGRSKELKLENSAVVTANLRGFQLPFKYRLKNFNARTQHLMQEMHAHEGVHPCSVLVCELSIEVTQVQGFCFVIWIEFLKDAYSTLLSCQLSAAWTFTTGNESRRRGVLVSSQPKLHLSTLP
jgi:hypothetical protein